MTQALKDKVSLGVLHLLPLGSVDDDCDNYGVSLTQPVPLICLPHQQTGKPLLVHRIDLEEYRGEHALHDYVHHFLLKYNSSITTSTKCFTLFLSCIPPWPNGE